MTLAYQLIIDEPDPIWFLAAIALSVAVLGGVIVARRLLRQRSSVGEDVLSVRR